MKRDVFVLPYGAGLRIRPILVDKIYSFNFARRRPVPTLCSAMPWPYRGAVSKNVTPNCAAVSTAVTAISSSRYSYISPSGALPKPKMDTSILVFPSLRFFITQFPKFLLSRGST